MSLLHEFILIPQDEIANIEKINNETLLTVPSSNKVEIHDDIIQYIFDTLRWVPTINTCKNNENGLGLNNWGITLISKDGAEVLMKISKAWADLFSNGPSKIILKGKYTWTDEKIDQGQYEILEFDRNELVGEFIRLYEYSQSVINENYYLFHRGI